MAQRQFRSDDTSLWIEKFGYGSDGAYSPSTGTDAPIDSACTGTINTTSLTATNAGFTTGQLILIHQTQGTGAGQWELNKIANYSVGTITLTYPLIFGYVTGAQVLVMPQYSSGLIDTGVTITGKAWNGTVGGIYAKFCNGTFTIAGSLVGTGVGFRGGGGGNNYQGGVQGEGTPGSGTQSYSANGNGGGGVPTGNNSSGGSGGGNATIGTNGTNGSTGGAISGLANLTNITFGGAGGAGGDNSGFQGNSGNGANSSGIILIIAKAIVVTGAITSSGVNGSNPGGNGNDGAGGGSAGGSVLLKAQTITLGSSLVVTNGSSGGTGTNGGGNGGAGSVGRIHADYSTSLTGTTNPTIDTTQDFSLQTSGTLTTNKGRW